MAWAKVAKNLLFDDYQVLVHEALQNSTGCMRVLTVLSLRTLMLFNNNQLALTGTGLCIGGAAMRPSARCSVPADVVYCMWLHLYV